MPVSRGYTLDFQLGNTTLWISPPTPPIDTGLAGPQSIVLAFSVPVNPLHHFTAADIVGSLLSVCLYPLFVLVPGFAIAWLLDLFDFRRRTPAFRVCLSIPLSIAVCPVLSYLLGRFLSMRAVWGWYVVLWLYFLAVRRRHWRDIPQQLRWTGIPRQTKVAALLVAGWTAIVVVSLVDLQFGDKAYYSVLAFDHSVRVQFIHSITTTGIPPANPFFSPGYAIPLRYHYFWLILCSLVEQAGGPLVGARRAWVGGTVWCGLGLMAIVVLYLRTLCYRGAADFPRRAITGILLLGATGLDILPTAVLWLLRATGIRAGIFPSVEFWNEQVDGFVSSAFWQAHQLSGLIACLTAFLLLGEASRQPSVGGKVKYAAIGAIALASSVGLSIYVSFVFSAFLLVWTVITIVKRWWSESFVLLAAGLGCAFLVLPYVVDLMGPAAHAVGGGGPLAFWIRPFLPVDSFLQGSDLPGWIRPLANLLLLPVNYFLELGFFFTAGIVWWMRRRTCHQPLSRNQLAMTAMVCTSVAICTFLRSTVIGNNDLGWRGFLVAQFALLLAGVDIIAERDTGVTHRFKTFLTALLVLGWAGTAYDVTVLRIFPLLADHGIATMRGWMAPGQDLGHRTFASREAYEWLANHSAPNAVIQFNPHLASQETYASLYANRRMVASDEGCGTAFGGDVALCNPLISTLDQVYPLTGHKAARTIDGVCRSLPIDVMVARDTDPSWSDPESWVWAEHPVFANRFIRLFACPNSASHQ